MIKMIFMIMCSMMFLAIVCDDNGDNDDDVNDDDDDDVNDDDNDD